MSDLNSANSQTLYDVTLNDADGVTGGQYEVQVRKNVLCYWVKVVCKLSTPPPQTISLSGPAGTISATYGSTPGASVNMFWPNGQYGYQGCTEYLQYTTGGPFTFTLKFGSWSHTFTGVLG